MTFAELEQLPEPLAFRYELHHGELVRVPPSEKGHLLIQRNLRRSLETFAGEAGLVDTEIGFRATPEQEYRVADVAFVSQARWESIPRKGNLQGAPDLVIEVLSPSNTATEIFDKEQLCLENGAQEFWVVDPILCQVRISTPGGRTQTYRKGQQVPLFFGGSVAVDDIFSEY